MCFSDIDQKLKWQRGGHTRSAQLQHGAPSWLILLYSVQSRQNIIFETKHFLAFWIYVAALCSWECTVGGIQAAPSWLFLISFSIWEERASRVQLLAQISLSPGTERWSLPCTPALAPGNAILVAAHTHHLSKKAPMNASPNQVATWHFLLCCFVSPLPLKAWGEASRD